jgi:hypothetical protein
MVNPERKFVEFSIIGFSFYGVGFSTASQGRPPRDAARSDPARRRGACSAQDFVGLGETVRRFVIVALS